MTGCAMSERLLLVASSDALDHFPTAGEIQIPAEYGAVADWSRCVESRGVEGCVCGEEKA